MLSFISMFSNINSEVYFLDSNNIQIMFITNVLVSPVSSSTYVCLLFIRNSENQSGNVRICVCVRVYQPQNRVTSSQYKALKEPNCYHMSETLLLS